MNLSSVKLIKLSVGNELDLNLDSLNKGVLSFYVKSVKSVRIIKNLNSELRLHNQV